MAVRRLNHAVLYVHDLASAVEFYTTVKTGYVLA